jgi:hypothetical protein
MVGSSPTDYVLYSVTTIGSRFLCLFCLDRLRYAAIGSSVEMWNGLLSEVRGYCEDLGGSIAFTYISERF